MEKLVIGGEAIKIFKAKMLSSAKYKKGSLVNNKQDIQEILNDAVMIEMLEQTIYDNEHESATIRIRWKQKK